LSNVYPIMDQVEKLGKNGRKWIKERALHLYISKGVDLGLATGIASEQYFKKNAQKTQPPAPAGGRDAGERSIVKSSSKYYDFYKVRGNLDLIPKSEIRVYEHLEHDAIKVIPELPQSKKEVSTDDLFGLFFSEVNIGRI